MIRQADTRIGWVVSLGVHGILALLFLFAHLSRGRIEPEPTPVAFISFAAGGSKPGVAAPQVGGMPAVDLPRRPTLDETSPLLRLPESSREIAVAPPRRQRLDLAERPTLDAGRLFERFTPLAGRRARAPVAPMKLDEEMLLPGPNVDPMREKIAAEKCFDIVWEGPKREMTAGRLPEFPPGVRRSATVRLEVMVAPDGSVISTELLTKGLPELDRVSVEAVRTWRFSKLDAALPQKNQRGVVTFNYRLK